MTNTSPANWKVLFGSIVFPVYDKPLLAWLIQQEFTATLEMLDTTFEPQHYAFAIANNSKLRAPLNIAILDATQSTWWKDVIARYLGTRIN
ncbi:hypothetical protein [Streptomyces canarius]